MNLKKLAALCKRTGTLRMVRVGSVLFAGTETALYMLPGTLPVIHNPEELMAVLGYSDKEADKMYTKNDRYEELLKNGGPCLDDALEGEQICDESHFDIVAGQSVLHGLECDDDTIGFIDNALLAPVADEVSSYTEFYRRRMSTGKYYYVIKDGMDLLAMFMPMQVLCDELAGRLEEMSNMVYHALYGNNYTSKYMGVLTEKTADVEEEN